MNDLEQITKRLERLEKQNRWLKRVDSKGKQRAYLTSDGDWVRFGIKNRLDYIGDDVFSISYDLTGHYGIKLKMFGEDSQQTVIQLGNFTEKTPAYGQFGFGICQPGENESSSTYVMKDGLARYKNHTTEKGGKFETKHEKSEWP